MDSIKPFDLPIEHHFGGGVCIKSLKVAAGETVVQHQHAYDHLSYVVHGTVEVAVEDRKFTVTGPACLLIEANKHHGVKAVTEALWLCIHATDVADPEGVDKVLIGAAEDLGEVRRLVEVLR